MEDIYWLRDYKCQCQMLVQLSYYQGMVCESYQLLLNIAHRSRCTPEIKAEKAGIVAAATWCIINNIIIIETS